MAEMEADARPVLVPGGNKTVPVKPVVPVKPLSKPLNNLQMVKSKDPVVTKTPSPVPNPREILKKKKEASLHRNLSLDASCSSDASSDSSCSRPSSGSTSKSRRVNVVTTRTKKEACKEGKVGREEKEMVSGANQDFLGGKRRCSWVTANAEPCYVSFHDEEWGAPVHDDRKLFELLVLSGALAELTWPVILSKRRIFREVFMDFDPISVSKLNEKKLVAPGSAARSLLSEPKLRSVIENSKQILKSITTKYLIVIPNSSVYKIKLTELKVRSLDQILDEFGSFDRYIWGFVNHKPIVSRFRYPRQVPIKTSKAEMISKDMVRRGLRCVGPTVVYTFMQVAGLTNDHLVSCFCFEKCVNTVSTSPENKKDEKPAEQEKRIGVEELTRDVDLISV